MKNYRILIFVCFTLLNYLHPISVQAEENKVYFDFSKMTISAYGVYNANSEDKRNGLFVELNARKNAITNLTTYFKNSCTEAEYKTRGTKPSWETAFRSRGSEIYSNGFLKIALTAPIRQVLKSPAKKKTLKTSEGEKIIFSMPGELPGNIIHCGAIELDIGDNKKVMVSPGEIFLANTANDLAVVNLTYDAKTGLKPSTPEDATILQDSNLLKDENVSSGVVPIPVLLSE